MQLTDQAHAKVETYLRKLAGAAHLAPYWSVSLSRESADEVGFDECLAVVRIHGAHHEGEVHIACGFEQLTPERQRHVLCHELMHLRLRDLTQAAGRVVDAAFGEGASPVAVLHRQALEDTEEQVVDGLGRMLGDLLGERLMPPKVRRWWEVG